MYIPYEEFEKVMSQCHEVFTSWDDEYDKLQGLMRDIVKKKRDEHLKMVWRVNFSHKRLQERMQHMVKFRRQHEQLRTVIVRVLRPTLAQQVSQPSQADLPAEEIKPELLALEAADANAIDEVNLAYENVKEVDGLDITKEGSEAWEAAIARYDGSTENFQGCYGKFLRNRRKLPDYNKNAVNLSSSPARRKRR